MNKQDIVDYWITSAANDYRTMKNLMLSEEYSWSLFVGHIVIEKLLKALYAQEVDENVPKTHDLSRLAVKSGLTVSDEILNQLDRITTFNISTRYPDFKLSFYKKCDRQFATQSVAEIEEARKWILEKLQKQ